MNLNEKQKIQVFREKTVELLNGVPEGKRMHIDKNMLEKLLFDEIVYNKNTGETLKLPVWSGDFLRKIDLSEVDFEDVSWSLIVEYSYDCPEDKFIEYMDDETYDEIGRVLPTLDDDEKINYSNTNAKIDFKKSFEYKKIGQARILFCDFSNVDLSNNTFTDERIFAANSNFANTKLNIDYTSKNEKKHIQMYFCDLTNIDLTNMSMDLFKYMYDQENIANCILTNTGVNFKFDINSDHADLRMEERINTGIWKEDLCYTLSKEIEGCYINGKRVLSKEEVKNIRKTKLEEYKQYKQSLTSSFEEQFKKDNNIKL